MRVAAGVLDVDDLLEHRQVVAAQERAAVDDHVDLVGARLGGGPRLGELDVAERLARREAGRDRGDLDGRALERFLRVGDERRVDADRRDRRDRRIARLGVHRPSRRAPGSCPACPFPRGSSDPSSGSRGRAPRASTGLLIERFFSESTRSSTPTWSTRADPPEQAARARRGGRPTSGRARGRARGRGCRGGGWWPWDGEDTPASGEVRACRSGGRWRCRMLALAAAVDLRQRRQAALAVDEEMPNQSRTTARFSTRRNGVPERVSSCVSSGTRSRRTGRFLERSTVKRASAWPIVVRMSLSLCWMRSGVRMSSA